jgi:hypothetical protein
VLREATAAGEVLRSVRRAIAAELDRAGVDVEILMIEAVALGNRRKGEAGERSSLNQAHLGGHAKRRSP